MNHKEEKLLRENIRDMIRFVKQKNSDDKAKLKTIVKEFVKHEFQNAFVEASTPDVSPTPNKSTGINVLEELLKKIIPVLEVDYKSLTTNIEQRQSFRSLYG